MASDSHSERTLVIVNCILNVPLILICIVGNALVLIAASKSRRIRSSSMEILSSLAFSDLLFGIIAQPLFLAHQFTKESFLNSLMVLIVYPIWPFISTCDMQRWLPKLVWKFRLLLFGCVTSFRLLYITSCPSYTSS